MKPSERIYEIYNDDPRSNHKGVNPEVLRIDAIINYLDEHDARLKRMVVGINKAAGKAAKFYEEQIKRIEGG